MYKLHIANKNYSSWSLRPWLLMKACGVPFTEVFHRFGEANFASVSPTGRVPCLVDGSTVVWDSLAIVEYLAERHAHIWPTGASARAWARCAAAEMHSGFATLRNQHSMSVGQRITVSERSPALLADIARIESLWNEGLTRFGGSFLAGAELTAVDAFFAPVAYRFRTFGVSLSGPSALYLERMLSHPAMQQWEAAALAEDFREEQHEAELRSCGTISADLRAPIK
jgi:glutathione S-transferase